MATRIVAPILADDQTPKAGWLWRILARVCERLDKAQACPHQETGECSECWLERQD